MRARRMPGKQAVWKAGGAVTHDELLETFSNRLGAAMCRRGLNVVDMARKAYCNRATIYNYINGSCLPGTQTLYLIADALNVSTDWLLGRREQKRAS